MQLVWFRHDLRVTDHAALCAARAQGPCIGVFLLCSKQWREHDVGDHRLGFLQRSLCALQRDLALLNIPLHIARAATFAEVPVKMLRIAKQYHAMHIHCSAEQPLNERERDKRTALACTQAGIELSIHEGNCILPPGTVNKDDGTAYSVFTPFKKRWLTRLTPTAREPLPTPTPQDPALMTLVSATQQRIPRRIDGASSSRLAEQWPGGATVASSRLQHFIHSTAGDYADLRDLPLQPGTSTLSPYLAVGAISPRQCLAAALAVNEDRATASGTAQSVGISTWINELIWRDFYRHVITLFPSVNMHRAFRPKTDNVPWRHDSEQFSRWCEGQTGYPLVDAGMRQLNQLGWMHNRLRMVTAMFLTKHLLIDWRWGERYFMQQLVDGDFASNNGGWQWSASTGTDAAPYFRIFNPVAQAQKYDPSGEFVVAQVPQLQVLHRAVMPKHKKLFYQPWASSQSSALATQGGYPKPMVDHALARQRVLDAFKTYT